ncbi:MAG: site-specific integrase [Defluviitaleaceae bacterium]|nr:site-specific integrase [Defluviitaleaceae bacterium]
MRRRTNGEGTIYQRPNGLWVGEITTGYDIIDGKKKRLKKRFTNMNREELLKQMNNEKYKINRNIVTVKSDYTVGEWVLTWLNTYKRNIIKHKTYDCYEFAYRHYINDSIGDIKLNKIQPEAVQQLYNRLLEKKLSTSSIKKVHVTLNQAFDQALKSNLIYSNPCRATSLPKSTVKLVTAMSVSEQDILINHCEDKSTHNFFVFLLNTGIRCGEGLALTWDDIDFVNKQISICKTMSVIINRDASGDAPKRLTIVDESTKTASSTRTIPMNKHAERILLAQKSNPANDFYIFATRTSKAIAHRNMSRSFSRLMKTTGLQKSFSLHSLRHTFATRLLEKNVSPKVVSDILGHKSINITLNLYSHVMPGLKQEAVDLL